MKDDRPAGKAFRVLCWIEFVNKGRLVSQEGQENKINQKIAMSYSLNVLHTLPLGCWVSTLELHVCKQEKRH